MFEREYQVAWGDLDFNRHMANTAYLDYAAQTRFVFLAQHGFTPQAFEQAAIGPAVLEETITYRRELRFLERFKVTFEAAGQNADGSKNMIVNRIIREDGKVAAEVRTLFVWMDLNARKATPPPPTLLAAMNALSRTEDFREL